MDKVAVITGSAKGLGRAIALALAKGGFTIVVHYNKSGVQAKQVLGQIKNDSPGSITVSADLRDAKQVERMFEQIFAKFKKIDLLVNNVGNFLYKKLEETTPFEFRDIIESNIYSSFFCSRAVLPSMRKAKSGHIINIGAVGADTMSSKPKSTPYFMAKNALYLLTKTMAHEEARYGIHINMISPVSLVTDIFRPSDFPMGRSASYEDVIKVLEFLISEDAYYINGANIEVAGAFVPPLT